MSLGPPGPWIMGMHWLDLAFLHWPVPAAALSPFLPAPLVLDRFEGNAWLGIVPFAMDHVHLRCLPPIPGTASFLELNLRTYVTDGRKPGVWFFSLEAENPLAVLAARALAHLPYMDARMACQRREGWLEYTSRRTHRGEPEAEFSGRYRPAGAPFRAAPGSLEHWLTERYCLYSADRRGRVYRCDIAHPPWTLRPCQAELRTATLTGSLGLALPLEVPLAHGSERQEVRAWWPVPLEAEPRKGYRDAP